MKRLTSIVALNEDGAIGYRNELPWKLKSDLKFFQEKTIGNVVIMGRKTFQSIGKPLPGRFNIVISHNSVLFPESENSVVAISVGEALYRASIAKGYNRNEVYVVGGAQIYSLFAPFVDRYLFTLVDKPVPNADAFFDANVVGDLDNWDFQLITDVVPDRARDDAPFTILQVDARDLAIRTIKRAELIEQYGSKVVAQPSNYRGIQSKYDNRVPAE